jgi:hypothetical protein
MSMHIESHAARNITADEGVSRSLISPLLLIGVSCTATCLSIAWVAFLGWLAAYAIGLW